MIVSKLWARLGNQCFQIAAAIAHAKRMNTTYAFPRFSLDPRIWPTYFTLPIAKHGTRHYYKEPRHAYDTLPDHDDMTIEGYFQSFKYFENPDAKYEITQALGFKYEYMKSHVAIHVRRGDYLQYADQFPVLPEQYYFDAIDYMISRGMDSFKVYSDDIAWCRKTFDKLKLNISYSDNKSPLVDMVEIYNHRNLIIANSSFSLFPACLRYSTWMDIYGEYDCVIIAPAEHRWYGPANAALETCDLMKENWIKI